MVAWLSTSSAWWVSRSPWLTAWWCGCRRDRCGGFLCVFFFLFYSWWFLWLIFLVVVVGGGFGGFFNGFWWLF